MTDEVAYPEAASASTKLGLHGLASSSRKDKKDWSDKIKYLRKEGAIDLNQACYKNNEESSPHGIVTTFLLR